MYIDTTIEDILRSPEDYSGYSLCYIDDIPETIWDRTPETKEYVKDWTEEDWQASYEKYGISNPKLQYKAYPNPLFIPGKQTKFAYFCNIPLDKVWGDDWDDAPYEHNASGPYDACYEECDLIEAAKLKPSEYAIAINPDRSTRRLKKVEHNILKIPFHVSDKVSCKEPKDYSCSRNSPFSVQDINSGAIPWLFIQKKTPKKSIYPGVVINAGIDPYHFILKLIEAI